MSLLKVSPLKMPMNTYCSCSTEETSHFEIASLGYVYIVEAPGNLGQAAFKGYFSYKPISLLQSKRGYIPILADYKPDNDEVKIRQQVSFEGCIFEDIVFGEDRPNDSEIATMMKASHPANSITFKECVFRNIQAFRQV